MRAEGEEGDDEDVEGGEVEEEHADQHHLERCAGMVLLQHLSQGEDVGEEEVAGHDHHLDLQAELWRGEYVSIIIAESIVIDSRSVERKTHTTLALKTQQSTGQCTWHTS